ncbi:homeodomain-like protein [Tanacetum coccineum]
MKEQAFNKDKDQDQDSRTQRQSNLKKPKIVNMEAWIQQETTLRGRLLESRIGSAFQIKILLNLTQSEQVLHSLRKLFKTTSFDHSSLSEFELFDHEGHFEEGITETMMEPTMEEYMMRTREDYGSGISRPKFNKDSKFELKEIKKVNEKVYAAQVRCELCNGPHYTKDCPLKEEGKTLEEAYYTQFRVPFPQVGRYRATALGFYQRDNGNTSYQERR